MNRENTNSTIYKKSAAITILAITFCLIFGYTLNTKAQIVNVPQQTPNPDGPSTPTVGTPSATYGAMGVQGLANQNPATTPAPAAAPSPYVDVSNTFNNNNNSGNSWQTTGQWDPNAVLPTQTGVDTTGAPKATVVDETGASSATANKSNTGATAGNSSAAASSAGNSGACVGGQMLARLLTSSISSAMGGAGKNMVIGVAQTATHVPVTYANTPEAANQEIITNAHTGANVFGVQTGVSWDGIAYCIVNTIIDYLVNSTIAWANSGFKGNPAFIRNPEQFFKGLADQTAAQFIREVAYDETGIDVCKPFRVVIATGLAGSYSNLTNGKYVNSCSLSQMQQTAMQSGSYSITTPTDWLALTKPQNNAYYSYISASDELSKRVAVKNNTAKLDLTLNRGFMSQKKCKDDTKPESKTNPCDTTTPGSVIADSLSKTLNIPKDRLVSAQKFDQMVDAIVNNLIKIALSDVLTAATGKAPTAVVASDYYTTVANNSVGGSGSSAANIPTGPTGTGGTNGASGDMMQAILNGATFTNMDWNTYALQQIVASGIVDVPVRDASKFFSGGTPTAQGYLSIMAAIAQRESGGLAKPPRYHETKIGDGSTYSVGLMSLTPGDYGTGGMTYDDLEDPYNNIRVAVGIMAKLVRQFGVISGPPDSSHSAGTGLSAYWSTFKF